MAIANIIMTRSRRTVPTANTRHDADVFTLRSRKMKTRTEHWYKTAVEPYIQLEVMDGKRGYLGIPYQLPDVLWRHLARLIITGAFRCKRLEDQGQRGICGPGQETLQDADNCGRNIESIAASLVGLFLVDILLIVTVLRRSTSPPLTGQGTGRHCFTAALGEEVDGEECGTTAAGRNRGPGCFFTRMVNCVRYGITRGGREASGAERCQDDASPRMFDSCSKEKHNSGSCPSGDDMNGPSVSLGGF